MKTNIILQGNAIEKLRELPEKSINMLMTSPPYWALRDYSDETEVIWDEDENCEHDWEIGKVAGDPRIKKRSERRAGWERPSREEFANRTVENICPICNNEFNGKPGQKFCSIKCLNTLSNAERTAMQQTSNFCQKCAAWKGQLGLEPTFDLYIKHLCDIFDEVKRVLRDDGIIWVNIGDTYNSHSAKSKNVGGFEGKQMKENPQYSASKIVPKKEGIPDKCLTMIPFRFAIEMVNRGWILRNTIIWYKRNCMPSSVKDRFTVDFEYLFFFSKKKKYYFETQYEPHLSKPTPRATGNPKYKGIKEMGMRHRPQTTEQSYGKQGRNKRTVWTINPKPFSEAHFAVYPEELCETPIKAGCPEFVCVKCLAPKMPEYNIEREDIPLMISKQREKHSAAIEKTGGRGEQAIPQYKTKTKSSFHSTCNCNAEFTGGIILDPFFGAGTTGLVALKQNKKFIGIELNKEYIEIAKKRLKPFLEQTKL